jgi:hypothetical protein
LRWQLHLVLTLCTLGLWIVSAIAAVVRYFIWPWRCEHCGWHQPDFRAPEVRQAEAAKLAEKKKPGRKKASRRR